MRLFARTNRRSVRTATPSSAKYSPQINACTCSPGSSTLVAATRAAFARFCVPAEILAVASPKLCGSWTVPDAILLGGTCSTPVNNGLGEAATAAGCGASSADEVTGGIGTGRGGGAGAGGGGGGGGGGGAGAGGGGGGGGGGGADGIGGGGGAGSGAGAPAPLGMISLILVEAALFAACMPAQLPRPMTLLKDSPSLLAALPAVLCLASPTSAVAALDAATTAATPTASTASGAPSVPSVRPSNFWMPSTERNDGSGGGGGTRRRWSSAMISIVLQDVKSLIHSWCARHHQVERPPTV